jgi:hypothetical protein
MELKEIRSMPRLRVLQGWLAVVALIVVTGVEFGMEVNTRSTAVVVALCLVPSAIISLLWSPVRTVKNGERASGHRLGA